MTRQAIDELNIFPEELFPDSLHQRKDHVTSSQQMDSVSNKDDSRAFIVRTHNDLIRGLKIKPIELYPDISQEEIDTTTSYPKDKYLTDNRKGCVLIMSNPFGCDRKDASTKDIESMKWLWEEQNGCELFDIGDVDEDTAEESQRATEYTRKDLRARIAANHPKKVYEGVTAEEMEELLMSLSETQKNYAYIVVVISTHGAMVTEKWLKEVEELRKSVENAGDGDEATEKNAKSFREYRDERKALQSTIKNGEIAGEMATADAGGANIVPATTAVFFGEDWATVRERKILKFFYNDKSFKLRGIPKFFILDYCRADGGVTDEPASAKKGKAIGYSDNSNGVEMEPQVGLPLMSDTVTAYATHSSHVAFDGKKGSWLILAIKNAFLETLLPLQSKRIDVLGMLTKANMKVSRKCNDKDAMSIFESSLVKKFYLYPKINHTKQADGSDADEEAKQHAQTKANYCVNTSSLFNANLQ